MARLTTIKFYRTNHKEDALELVLLEGEPFICLDTMEFFIGDGIKPVKELKPVSKLNNIVRASDGKLYQVNLGNNGVIQDIIPFTIYNKGILDKQPIGIAEI